MGVDSLLEMHTTLYGWYFYGITWDILSSTGILFLPILAVLIENWREPSESQDDKSAAETSLRRNMIQLPILAFIFMIAAYPAYQINPRQMTYDEDRCLQAQINSTNMENTTREGSTFVGVTDFSIGQTRDEPIKAPIFWALVTSAGAGLNSYIRSKIGCGLNLRDRYNSLMTVNTGDAQLNNDIRRFEKECYLGARKILQDNKKYEDKIIAKYTPIFIKRHCLLLKNKTDCRPTDPLATYEQAGVDNATTLNQLAVSEIKKCLGNPWCEIYFEQGLYSKCEDETCNNNMESAQNNLQIKGMRPFKPVQGFRYDHTRDADYTPAQKTAAQDTNPELKIPGTPTCADWWNSRETYNTTVITNQGRSTVSKPIGLKDRLNLHLNKNYTQQLLGDIKTRGYYIVNDSNNREVDAAAYAYVNDLQMRAYIDNAKKQKAEADFFGSGSTESHNLTNNIFEAMSSILSAYDTGKEAVKFKSMLAITKSVAPMLRAFILMGIYAFLLVYMMLSGYSLISLLPATFLIISIQLWPSLWQLAIVIDDNLFSTMFHNMELLDKYKNPLLSILFSILTGALFIILPILLSTILTLASASAGRAMAAALGNSGAGAVGLTGGNPHASKAVKTGFKAAKKVRSRLQRPG